MKKPSGTKTQRCRPRSSSRKKKSAPVSANPSGLAHDIAEQLEMAGRVQRNFLPSALPESDTVSFAALFKPADWVSGDIYDATRLDETHIGFYVADAVGHSLPAALLTIFIKQAIQMRQTYADNTYEIFSPQHVIEHLNRRMLEQQLAGFLFATSCYFLLDTQTLAASWCRAGHPYPVLIRNDFPNLLQSRGGLLGVFENALFQQQSVQLEPGDKILLYSDGAEHLIGKTTDTGEFIFFEDFLSIAHLPAAELINAINTKAQLSPLPPEHKDDITALALEIL